MPTTLSLHIATLVRKAEYRLSYSIIGARYWIILIPTSWVIRKVDDSRMRSHREDFRRNIDFLDPILRLLQRGSFVNKQAVIINLLGDPTSLTRLRNHIESLR